MRNHLKTLQNYNYVNMYIVYCDNMRNITSCDPRKGIIRYGVALFLFALFRNISQYISKYFKIFFEIFRKKCIPKSFERLRFFRKISHRSQFFRKIFACNFFRKISYIYFADVIYQQDVKSLKTLKQYQQNSKSKNAVTLLKEYCYFTARMLTLYC